MGVFRSETCHRTRAKIVWFRSRLEAILLGVPLLVLAEFEEARPGLQPPLAEALYGLDLVNYLWHVKD
jgi:hypothetical protein